MASDEALYNTLFNGAYLNPIQPLWLSYTSTNIIGPDIAVSTLTVNPYPAGNILLQSDTVSGTEYRAPLIFQRPPGDINAPSESLQMNLSRTVPGYPVDGEFITATKAGGTAYDDLAVKGIQIFGDQTTSGNSGACGYITCGPFPDTLSFNTTEVYMSSLSLSSLSVVSVISSTTSSASNYTASDWMSTPILYSQNIYNASTIESKSGEFSSINVRTAIISTAQISTASISTANISTLDASVINSRFANFSSVTISSVDTLEIDTLRISSIIGNIDFTLVSTLSLFGSNSIQPNINLGLGDVIQGMIGGAASQGLGAVLGGAALATGITALVSGRTSGGVDSNVFQTINGSTQLQFSTIGAAVSSVFLTTDSALPLTTPGVPIRQEIGVSAGTLCIRSVGDPLNVLNNISAIQMFGQWVPVPNSGGGSFSLPSSIFLSTVNVNGNLTQSGNGTFNWGGNTMSPTQVVLTRPTSVNTTLTTTGAAFLNAGATVNSGLTVASGGMTVPTGNVTVNNSLFVFQILQGQTIQATGSLSVGGGGVSIVGGGINMATGNLQMTSGSSVANITNVNVSQTLTANNLRTGALSTNSISTNNINLLTINNASYPPSSSIPSTLQASTITFNGGLSNIGSAPLNSSNAIFSNVTLSSINNAPYPPGGSGGIPSTLQASTISFNGGLSNIGSAPLFSGQINANNMSNSNTITSVNVYATNIRATDINLSNNGGNIDGGGQLSYQLAPGASKHTFRDSTGTNTSFIAEFYSNQTSRFFSTVTVRDTTWPIVGPSFARLQTYDPSFDSQPWGSVLTSNVSTTTANFNTGFTNLLNAASISSVNTGAINMGASNVTASNILIATQFSTSAANFMAFYRGTTIMYDVGIDTNSDIPGSYTLEMTPNQTNLGIIKATTLQTYYANIPGTPFTPTGRIFTSSISTVNVNTLTMAASNINTSNITTSNINVSSINNAIYPPTVSITPVGSITIWAGGLDNGSSQNFNIPTGWLNCDGSVFLNSTLPALAAVLGNKYDYPSVATPPGATRLPDLTFAVVMGTPYRNYANSIIPNIPSASILATTIDSAYNTTNLAGGGTQVSTLTTWRMTFKQGPALNYGTVFPGANISASGGGVVFPSVYISSIIRYPGGVDDLGFLVLRSVDGVTPIPRIPGTSTIGAYAQGTTPSIPDPPDTYYPDAPYTLGTPNVGGRSLTARVQTGIEVGVHQHFGTPNFNILGSAAFPNTSAGTGGLTDFNVLPDVSTIGPQAKAMPTAPNFLNMLYIIKT